MATSVSRVRSETLRTLPDDNVRQILWRFADRYDDLQMGGELSPGEVARGPVWRAWSPAGSVAPMSGPSKSPRCLRPSTSPASPPCSWIPRKSGYLAGPKNLALALTAFELAWVDAYGAICDVLLWPRSTSAAPEQRAHYMALAVPPAPERHPWRGAFRLTEPFPTLARIPAYSSGKLHVAEWADGKEPLLRVEKRGRFITNMGFANFVTAAVDSGDNCIKGSCIVIVEESDPACSTEACSPASSYISSRPPAIRSSMCSCRSAESLAVTP